MIVAQAQEEMAFQQQYEQVLQAIENAMEEYLSAGRAFPKTLQEAMRYSLQAPGKCLRPVMVVLACEVCGGDRTGALPAAVAQEMVHTYSLIHDDLPAMDDDDYRRGQPANHVAFGEGMAILAGDALLTEAFHVLTLYVKDDCLARQLVLELAHAAGGGGMIGGQVVDLMGQNTNGDLETVKYIHIHKTAMMFRAAMRMGALCAGAENEQVEMLGAYGLKLGWAFQIVDDLLDVTGTHEQMGKATQKDQKAGKLTYPSIIGETESRRQVDRLKDEALAVIGPLGEAARPLHHLADMLINRHK